MDGIGANGIFCSRQRPVLDLFLLLVPKDFLINIIPFLNLFFYPTENPCKYLDLIQNTPNAAFEGIPKKKGKLS